MNPLSPTDLLPYGPDFLWVDDVLEARDDGIVTRKRYTTDSLLLRSHVFDGICIVPGVILVEQVAQSACLAGLLAAAMRGEAPERAPRFVIGRVKAKFMAPAQAPCTVQAEIELRPGRRAIGFSGRLTNGTTPLAQVSGIAVQLAS